LEALKTVSNNIGIEMYVIGDKLQSIWFCDNLHEKVGGSDYAEKIEPLNIVRRFHNVKFMDFVNNIIKFDEYNLPKIEGVCDGVDCSLCDNSDEEPIKIYSYNIKPFNVHYKNKHDNKSDLTNVWKEIVEPEMKRLIDAYAYLPENFMFIFPIISKSPLARYLLNELQQFWIDIFADPNYGNKIASMYGHNSTQYKKYCAIKTNNSKLLVKNNNFRILCCIT
jgi:hypothetical protein